MSVQRMATPLSGNGAEIVARGLPPVKWDGMLTNSCRTTFLNCRRKFLWQYLRRLSPRTPSLPFLIGGLFHWGLERMYKDKGFNADAAEEHVNKTCDEACKAVAISSDMSDLLWQQSAVVMGMLAGYAVRYLKADLKAWKPVEVEGRFTYPLIPGWYATGKRDMVVRQRTDNMLLLVEHKTAKTVGASYMAKLPLDSQILGYAKSCRESKNIGALPKRVVYNVTRKPGIKLTGRETFGQYAKRVQAEYINRPESYFYRETLSFTDKEVQAYFDELLKCAAEVQRAIKEMYFSQNTSQCTMYGVCPYLRLCIAGPTQDVLSQYRVRADVHEELTEESDA